MNPDKAINFKRKVNARASALQSIGKSPEEILDAIMTFSDMPEGDKSRIKQAKASGQSQQALEGLMSATSVTEQTTQKDDFQVGGGLGKASRFLGIEKAGRRVGAELAKIDPRHRANLASLSEDEAETIGTGGVSNREFAGSAGNVALNLAGGALLKGGAKALGAGANSRFVAPILQRGARPLSNSQKVSRTLGNFAQNSPVKAGAVLGGAGGFTQGLNDEKRGLDLAESVGTGVALGGAIGSLPFVKRVLTGEKLPAKELKNAIENITPDISDTTGKVYKELLRQGRITPRTTTKPATVKLSERELAAVARHPDVISTDPVKSAINILDKIGKLDIEVGDFLTQNNTAFKADDLATSIRTAMGKIDDVAVPEERIAKKSEQMITNFMNSFEGRDMESLWQARKGFDQEIANAFSGSPTLTKDMKLAFRNSVQDFIAERTPNSQYKDIMKDMSSLFNVYDIAEMSASRQKNFSAIGQWFNAHPKLKWLGIVGGGSIAYGAINQITPSAIGGGAGDGEK